MRILIFTLTILMWVGFAGCSSKNATRKIELEYLDSLVSDGCSQMYTFDSIPIEAKKYVFDSDIMENATVKVNGTQIVLKKDTANSTEENSVWKNDQYVVEVRVRTAKQTGDEVYYDKGTITVKHEGKKKIIKIHGESGC